VIVNISSMLAYGGPPNLATYSASKAALNVLTKSAANTWKRDGIRVHAINLGWTVTPSERRVQTTLHGQPADWAEMIGKRMPFGRLLAPGDAASVIAFLVSDNARMMTGNIIDLEQYVMGTFETIPSLDGAPA
jgi:NAD(P)-dependent dehydrogenase (short-subunit alcohol dehydrogenase family)